jgi:hypothetical protein
MLDECAEMHSLALSLSLSFTQHAHTLIPLWGLGGAGRRCCWTKDRVLVWPKMLSTVYGTSSASCMLAHVRVCLCVVRRDLTIIVRSSKSATSKVGIGTGGVARGVWWGCAFLGLAKRARMV